jgi:hypothetical protein
MRQAVDADSPTEKHLGMQKHCECRQLTTAIILAMQHFCIAMRSAVEKNTLILQRNKLSAKK